MVIVAIPSMATSASIVTKQNQVSPTAIHVQSNTTTALKAFLCWHLIPVWLNEYAMISQTSTMPISIKQYSSTPSRKKAKELEERIKTLLQEIDTTEVYINSIIQSMATEQGINAILIEELCELKVLLEEKKQHKEKSELRKLTLVKVKEVQRKAKKLKKHVESQGGSMSL